VLDDEKLSHVADWLLGPPLKILAILVLACVANWVGRRAVKRSLTKLHSGAVRALDARKRTPAALLETGETSVQAEQRIDALSSVLRSVLNFVIWLTAGLICLGEVGINLGPLIAGGGVLGVAIGFGSQSLVRDFLSGAFILVEDQFGVGDIVDVGEASGTVEAVSLRTTRLRAIDGTVWHVPNGEIRRVGNMSQHWSRALSTSRSPMTRSWSTPTRSSSGSPTPSGRRTTACSRSPSCGAWSSWGPTASCCGS
jgi:small conductance mechanosensitive channel